MCCPSSNPPEVDKYFFPTDPDIIRDELLENQKRLNKRCNFDENTINQISQFFATLTQDNYCTNIHFTLENFNHRVLSQRDVDITPIKDDLVRILSAVSTDEHRRMDELSNKSWCVIL